jgi:hypothetical protein
VWAGTAAALVVLGPSARDALVIPTGAFDALSGAIDSLVVTGDGPALPGSTARLTGSVQGTFTRGDGSPLSKLPLELCPELDAYSTRHCPEAPFRARRPRRPTVRSSSTASRLVAM